MLVGSLAALRWSRPAPGEILRWRGPGRWGRAGWGGEFS